MNKLPIVLLLLAVLAFPAPHAKQESVNRLVLVFMNADNNLYPYSLKDLQEMQSASWDVEHAKVIVLLDGNGIGDTKLYEVLPGNLKELSAYRLGSEANMGDPSTLRSFIVWALKMYKPNYVFVDIRDHGGARIGASRDDSNNDYLTVQEIRDAIAGLPLTILGFDACLMGNIETLYELSTVYRGLVVASTLTEPGEGWDYRWLSVLSDPYVDPYTLAKAVVDYYINYYPGDIVTQAVYDLSLIDRVVSELNDSAALMLLDAMSYYSLYGKPYSGTLLESINDTIAGDGTSTVHVGDMDSPARKAYTVSLEANKTYEITLDREGDADLDLYVFSPDSIISPFTFYALSVTFDKPESVIFKASMSGERIIVVDHRSPETEPTNFTVRIKLVEAGAFSNVLTADVVYDPLKELYGIVNDLDGFVRYHEGPYRVSITAGDVSSLDMSYGDYLRLAFADAAPMRAQIVKLLTYGEAEQIRPEVSLENSTIGGIETVVQIHYNYDEPLELRLYNEITGERVKSDGDLSDLPMFPYIAYLVHEEDGEILGAYKVGEGYFGGKPVIIAPSVIGSKGSLDFEVYVSIDGTYELYLNDSYIGTASSSDHILQIHVEGFGELRIVGDANATITIVEDHEAPTVDVSLELNYTSRISVNAQDDVALKSVEILIDGYPAGDHAMFAAVFERNITIVAYDYAGNAYVDTKSILYSLSEHPYPNKAPQLEVEYELENTTLRLSIRVLDDDQNVRVSVYLDGESVRNLTYIGFPIRLELELGYGKHNVTIIAEDPYGAKGTRTRIFELTQPTEQPTGEGSKMRLIAIIIGLTIAIVILGLYLKSKK